MDKKNIVSTMIAQHRVLQKELGAVSEILENEPINIQKIIDGLIQFKKDLIEHLKLENEVFYKELLAEMEKNGQDTSKTKQFIAEMDKIEKAAVTFLEKYKNVQSIKDKINGFKKEFPGIIGTLNLRIESEEAGVYAYWGLF